MRQYIPLSRAAFSLFLVSATGAFTVPGFVNHRVTRDAALMGSSSSYRHNAVVQMSSTEAGEAPAIVDDDDSPPISITGNNIALTPALMAYVNKKLDRTIGKLTSSGTVRDCNVHLTVNKNPKVKQGHKAEVVMSLKGTTIRCAEESADMYASIDFVVDRLARKLVKYKERRLEGYHGGPNIGENIANFLNQIPDDMEELAIANGKSEDEEFVDPYEPQVTKIKSFDLSKPISIKEAIFALDYIDHDFYVFRDEESDQISVVYKRNAGGVGLIQPQP